MFRYLNIDPTDSFNSSDVKKDSIWKTLGSILVYFM